MLILFFIVLKNFWVNILIIVILIAVTGNVSVLTLIVTNSAPADALTGPGGPRSPLLPFSPIDPDGPSMPGSPEGPISPRSPDFPSFPGNPGEPSVPLVPFSPYIQNRTKFHINRTTKDESET